MARSKIPDADAAVCVYAEDFVERKDDRRRSRDDRAADDGHLALVNIAAPDGEAAVDDAGDSQHEAEHHDHGETVADAGLEFSGIERLSEGGQSVEDEDGGDRQERRQPRANSGRDFLGEFHGVDVFVFVSSAAFPPNTNPQSQKPGMRRCM